MRPVALLATALLALTACKPYDPLAVTHGPYTSARITVIQGERTTTYDQGSAYFEPQDKGFLSLTGMRPFTLQTATTPRRVVNEEWLSITAAYPGSGPLTFPGTVMLSRYDAEGRSREVWSDRAATITLERFQRQGDGPWGPLFVSKGQVTGQAVSSDGTASGTYTVTFETAISQR